MITQEAVDALITPENLILYLNSLPQDKETFYRVNCTKCVISKFIQHTFDKDELQVFHHILDFDLTGETPVAKTPEWAVKFLGFFDGEADEETTPKQAIQIWETYSA